jgi:uncharacterized DUF497 family protein
MHNWLMPPIQHDPKKALRNLKKHDVELVDAESAIDDPYGRTFPDPDSKPGEDRHVTLGVNATGLLVVAVWTMREGDTRMISAREPEPSERKTYEKGIQLRNRKSRSR